MVDYEKIRSYVSCRDTADRMTINDTYYAVRGGEISGINRYSTWEQAEAEIAKLDSINEYYVERVDAQIPISEVVGKYDIRLHIESDGSIKLRLHDCNQIIPAFVRECKPAITKYLQLVKNYDEVWMDMSDEDMDGLFEYRRQVRAAKNEILDLELDLMRKASHCSNAAEADRQQKNNMEVTNEKEYR